MRFAKKLLFEKLSTMEKLHWGKNEMGNAPVHSMDTFPPFRAMTYIQSVVEAIRLHKNEYKTYKTHWKMLSTETESQ